MTEQNHLQNTVQMVEKHLTESLQKFFGLQGKVTAQLYSKTDEYDYQTPYAMMYLKRIQFLEQGKDFKNTLDLAQYLKQKLQENYSEIFSKVEISEQFLLLQLNDSYLQEQISAMIASDLKLQGPEKKQKIIVDFSSPNIAKEMHVGHLRSTIMGESISRVLEYLGHDVVRVNHLGDWGTQFGMLIEYLLMEYPDFLTQAPNVQDLNKFYKESKKHFDSDPEFKKRAQLKVVALQQGDKEAWAAWQMLCKISLNYFDQMYKRLDIRNNPYGESYYNDYIPKVLKELEEKKLTKMDQGALCMFVKGFKVPLMLVKSDGGYNYDTTDIACAWVRLIEWQGDRMIYITDVGQFEHFDKIFKGAEAAGWYDPKQKRMEHMGFGVILAEDGKRMKTRSGDTVRLMSLLDEAKQFAKQQLMAWQEDMEEETQRKTMTEEEIDKCSEVLGVGAVKYFDLRQNRTQDYKFDLQAMTSQKGDTAVYLLYSYIRLASILKKSGFEIEDIKRGPFQFTDPAEQVIARHLVKFIEALDFAADKMALNTLCNFLFNLATKISSAINKYFVIGNQNTAQRIKLIYAAKKVMEMCLYLLGIQTVEKL